jgi:tRNA A37 methylthiotransferase MiaB
MTTCGVVKWTEDAAISAIERLVREVPEKRILVGGCLPKINPDRIRAISKNIIMFGVRESEILDGLISAEIELSRVRFTHERVREHSFGDPEIDYSNDELVQAKIVNFLDKIFNTSSFSEIYNYLTKGKHLWREDDLFEVKVSSGCGSNCSYCATKLAIGNLRSEDPQIIVDQVKLGVALGYTRIILMGDEVGFYGREIGSDIGKLVNLIFEAEPGVRLALRYVHPDALVRNYDALRSHFLSGGIYYFCSAFQSGSPRILRLMDRRPDLGEFMHVVQDIGEHTDAFKHTQIIVGFPQENEDDFASTLQIIRRCDFDYVTTTAYADRPGIKASELSGHLPEETIKDRHARSLEFVDENRNRQLWKRIQSELGKHIK